MREMESSLHESQESAKRRFQTLSSTIKLRNFDPVQEDTATKRPCKVYCGGMHESQQRLSVYYIIIRIDVWNFVDVVVGIGFLYLAYDELKKKDS